MVSLEYEVFKAMKTMSRTLSMIVVSVCSLRFLLDGISYKGFVIGHVDPLAYGSILTPVLAAYGYIRTKAKPVKGEDDEK